MGEPIPKYLYATTPFIMKHLGKKIFILIYSISLSLFWQSCDYNYYLGQELEKEARFEEANIEYRKAVSSNPDNIQFKNAFKRTSAKTVEDLVIRYKNYLNQKEHLLAYNRLKRAIKLDPKNEYLLEEQKKWFRILSAGKIEFEFRSLRNSLQLADEMQLAVKINTFNQDNRLIADIDNHTGIFVVEDVLYNPPTDLLMFYSISSIGIKLVNVFSNTKSDEYKSLVSLRTPVLTKISGNLNLPDNQLKQVNQYWPFELLKKQESKEFWYPPNRLLRYTLKLEGNRILVSSSNSKLDFLPQIIYMNKKDRRIFVDFGNLKMEQTQIDGRWSFRRKINQERLYLKYLEKNVILSPYFYFREGGYPFVIAGQT